MTPHSREARHKRAVAQTLRWAQEAASREAFSDALAWLNVVKVVDGALTPDWQRTQTSWRLLAQQRG
jgi:queuine/archaeosine tRNA-ribosyltransferase